MMKSKGFAAIRQKTIEHVKNQLRNNVEETIIKRELIIAGYTMKRVREYISLAKEY